VPKEVTEELVRDWIGQMRRKFQAHKKALTFQFGPEVALDLILEMSTVNLTFCEGINFSVFRPAPPPYFEKVPRRHVVLIYFEYLCRLR